MTIVALKVDFFACSSKTEGGRVEEEWEGHEKQLGEPHRHDACESTVT